MKRTVHYWLLFVMGLGLGGCAGLSHSVTSTPPDEARVSGGVAGEQAAAEVPGKEATAAEVTLGEDATEAEYLRYAALHNPALEAAFYGWQASREETEQAGSLSNPMFSYRYFIEEVETRVGAQRQSFEIRQGFPWFGTLRLREAVATEQAQRMYQRYDQVKRDLFYQVKKAYYEYYLLGRSIAITEENLALLGHLEGVARARYQTSAAGHPDLVRAQVELGVVEDRLRSLREMRGAAAAGFNAVLNRPVEEAIPWPKGAAVPEVRIDGKAALARLGEQNPELREADYAIRAERASIDLARKDFWPDFQLGAMYIETADTIGGQRPRDDGKDPIAITAAIEIPIQRGRTRAKVRQSEARHRAARSRRANLRNILASRLQRALYEYGDAGRKIGLYRDTLLPKARESLKVSEAAFRVGRGAFSDLIEAQRILLEYELALERARSERGTALAEIERLVGGIEPVSETIEQQTEK